MEFKYQTLFTCSPTSAGITAIKDFSELIASDVPPTAETIMQTIQLSFENAGLKILNLDLSPDLNTCHVDLEGEEHPLKISIRTRPSLVVNGAIYKLEEFDI